MNDGFAWWLVVLGIAIGIGLVWLYMIRLPRTEADVDETEMTSEADWISRTIEYDGGVAPSPLVEEVLVLHRQYLSAGAVPPAASPIAQAATGVMPPEAVPPPAPPSPPPPLRREGPGQMAEQPGE